MNQYGQMAMRHWQTNAPERFAAIADPDAFFTDLGEQAEEQISDLQTQLAGPDPSNEEYLAKVGRLTAAKSQAEEAVLSDLVWISSETSTEEAFEQWAASTSTRQRILNWVDQWQDADDQEQTEQLETAEQLAEELGLPATLIEEARVASSPASVLRAHEETLTAALRREWDKQGRPAA